MNKNNREDNYTLILDYFHRIGMHNAFWYLEAVNLYGIETAGNLSDSTWKKSSMLLIDKIKKSLLDAEEKDNFSKLSMNDIEKLRKSVATAWLAFDGIWFQEIENFDCMANAKKCNDNAWEKFSPFEASRIKSLLGLEKQAGLKGLKRAFEYRLYTDINKQSIANETSTSFDFFMNECRVQIARNRKGLDDYPCKSAGIIEYTTFAKTIDSRIETSVISCPPDKHPSDWFCGWRFKL